MHACVPQEASPLLSPDVLLCSVGTELYWLARGTDGKLCYVADAGARSCVACSRRRRAASRACMPARPPCIQAVQHPRNCLPGFSSEASFRAARAAAARCHTDAPPSLIHPHTHQQAPARQHVLLIRLRRSVSMASPLLQCKQQPLLTIYLPTHPCRLTNLPRDLV